MATLEYKKVSVERDSEGKEKITLYLVPFRATVSPLDIEDLHKLTMTPDEWLDIRNSVNKLLGER